MATVNYISYKTQSRAALHGVAGYIVQDKKTLSGDGQRLASGQNCSARLAFREFAATREMHRKKSPVWFYHYTQSFHPDENITGEEAHAIAKEFAARAWPESEVLIATHMDAAHIHSHFLVNAVCYESGRMLRQGPGTLMRLRQISDEICMEHRLSVLPPKRQKKDKQPGAREYRSAVKGESWKFQLMNTIDECMRYAADREDFIRLMRSEGYVVRWSDSRKHITYTTPEGMKCRDVRLHEEKYLKEVMELEFGIRTETLYGRIAPEEHTAEAGAGDQHPVPNRGAGRHADRQSGDDDPSAEYDQSEVGWPGNADGAGTDTGDADSDTRYAATGWEKERAAFLTSAFSAPPNTYPAYVVGTYSDWSGAAGSLVQLGKALERSSGAVPVRDGTTMPGRADRKQREKEREKKVALGHRPDDHEDEQSYSQQTM